MPEQGFQGFPSPAAAGLNHASAFLSANVSMPSAGTYYGGPSLLLAAGTWLVLAGIVYYNGTANGQVTAKIWDGTTAATSQQGSISTTGSPTGITLAALVTLTTTTTYKISVAGSSGGGALQAATLDNPAGNTACWIVAVQIA